MSTQYDAQNNRLVMLRQAPTADFWDSLWESANLREQIEHESRNTFYVGQTERFIAARPGIRMLDAGCGRGAVVLSHARAGYEAYGVDFAARTVADAQRLFPELKVEVADVRTLPFPNSFFDAYWSLGVIEHFFEGYAKILEEARRVLKPGGYLFITFPHLSGLRRFKIGLGSYKAFSERAAAPADFYQFILSHRQVLRDLTALGFRLRYHRAVDGLKGLSTELPSVRNFLQRLQASHSRLAQITGTAITEAASPIAGHVMLLVLQRDTLKH